MIYTLLGFCVLVFLSLVIFIALKWALRRGYVGAGNSLQITRAVFAVIFLLQVTEMVFGREEAHSALAWSALLMSLAVVIVSQVQIARTR